MEENQEKLEKPVGSRRGLGAEEKTSHTEDVKNRVSETLESIKKNDRFDRALNYAKHNIPETIAFVLMAVGILWMLISRLQGAHGFYGGVLVGLISGFYLSKEIVKLIRDCEQIAHQEGFAKTVIVAATALAFFLVAPGIFIGAAIMVGIKVMLRFE